MGKRLYKAMTHQSRYVPIVIYICLVCIVTFKSCKCLPGVECFPQYTGKVLSNFNKQPVEGATVLLINQNIIVKTDKNGFFKLETSGCFDAHLKISKQHYKPFEITFTHSSNSNTYEVKSESIFVDYDKPFYPDSNNKGTVITGTWIEQDSENFSVFSGEKIYYLDTLKTIKEEINEIQNNLRNSKRKWP